MKCDLCRDTAKRFGMFKVDETKIVVCEECLKRMAKMKPGEREEIFQKLRREKEQ